MKDGLAGMAPDYYYSHILDDDGSAAALPADLAPSRRKPPDTTWQLYGRAIVPLSSLICNYGQSEVEIEKGPLKNLLPPLAKLCGFNTTKSSNGFWLHLFPHVTEELKFYKPVAGYPGFGMTNPKYTLGFLKVIMNVKFTIPPPLAPVVSSLWPPTSYWINSYTFEPQVRLPLAESQ